MTLLDLPKLRRALSRVNSRWRLRQCQALGGRATTLHVDAEGSSQRLVLLSHSPADRALNPHIARDEYRLLGKLHEAGLPVPEALALDESHEPPFLITSFVEGAPRMRADNLEPFCQQLAATLSAIHALELELPFLPRLEDRLLADMNAPGAGRIQAGLRAAYARLSMNAPTLLHGDFWLGNLLWQGETLAGIIDWEDAMLGDPLADLGKSRLEMLWTLGPMAMARYTAAYLALNPGLDAGALPFWDLWGASRLAHFKSFASDAQAERRMAVQYAGFVEAALEAIEE